MFKLSHRAVRIRQSVLAALSFLLLSSALPYDEGEGIVTIGTEATPSHATGASTGTLNAGADAWVACDDAINGAAYLGGNGGTVVVLPGYAGALRAQIQSSPPTHARQTTEAR